MIMDLVTIILFASVIWMIAIVASLLLPVPAYPKPTEGYLLATRPSILPWRDFEISCAEFLAQIGATDVVHCGEVGKPDGGIDIICTLNGKKTIVQCKHWRRDWIGVSLIRELYGVMHHFKAGAAIFITGTDYTSAARQFAIDKPITLLKRNILNDYFNALNQDNFNELLMNMD